jgi:microcystin-dependent protein
MATDTPSPFADAPSARLKLPAPVLTDPCDVPLDIKALRDSLDPVTVVFAQGPAGAMPAAGTSGRYWWATDTKVLFYDDGTTWYQPGAMSPGDLKPTAVSTAPLGWLLCNGGQYSRSDYAVLFNAIGLAWTGTDDGATFNVPDLRGRAPIGAGQGPGLTNHLMGQRGGEESHVLSGTEMPSHGHGVSDPTHAHSVYDPSHGHTQWGADTQWTYGGGSFQTPTVIGSWGGNNHGTAGAGTGIQIYGAGTGISIQAAGGNGAHGNMQPWAAVNWLIKT